MRSLKTIIFTGVSGGGKTTALRAVEDLGFYCVDNLPLALLNDFIKTMEAEPLVDRAALVVDSRLGKNIDGYAQAYLDLKQSGHDLEVIYLDCNDETILRRFSQTRRRHPLGDEDLRTIIEEERHLLAPLRAQAVACIDSSDFTPHQLRQLIQDRYDIGTKQLVVSLISFGYRYGLPSYADLVFDVRFLPNPFFIDEMRSMTGLQAGVADYVLNAQESQEFLKRVEDLLHFLLPRYQAEGKSYLTVAVGCTGGQHRSVAIAEELGRRLRETEKFTVKVRHGDLEHAR